MPPSTFDVNWLQVRPQWLLGCQSWQWWVKDIRLNWPIVMFDMSCFAMIAADKRPRQGCYRSRRTTSAADTVCDDISEERTRRRMIDVDVVKDNMTQLRRLMQKKSVTLKYHLLIHLSTRLCHHPRSHHPSLLHSVTPGSKPTFSTNPSHVDFFYLLDCLTIMGLDRTYHAHHIGVDK